MPSRDLKDRLTSNPIYGGVILDISAGRAGTRHSLVLVPTACAGLELCHFGRHINCNDGGQLMYAIMSDLEDTSLEVTIEAQAHLQKVTS